MKLSANPDLTSTRGLALTTLAVSALVWTALIAVRGDITTSLGDTDDAMRLVQVRELLHGRGWYDQLVTRLAPPAGVYMHWSRLLDGGIAGLDWLFSRVLPADRAEWATRFVWPLLWIPPAVAGALVIAREAGAKSAVFIAAPLMLTILVLYRQFLPGRIDHHDVQITLAVLAVAGAASSSSPVKWAVVSGVAAGLGLAVGLEALVFHAVVGASFALRFVADRAEAKRAAAYGLALALSTLSFYALQTPPWRWGLSFCDAIGLNLALALSVAGGALALGAAASRQLPTRGRLAVVAAAGALAAGLYLIADPACRAGPFAGLDPRVRPFWFDLIQEIQPLPKMLAAHLANASQGLAAMLMGLAAAIFLAVRRLPRPDAPSLILIACMGLASLAAFQAWRMFDYVFWFGAPLLAAGLSYAARRFLGDRMVPTLAAAVFVSPFFIAAAAAAAVGMVSPVREKPGAPQQCYDVAAYRPLGALPPGVVLTEIDLGPHILANTPHAAVAAPYHRMAAAILAAHEAFVAPPGAAEARVRALHADYVVDCPGLFVGVSPGSLGWTLRQGQVPPWLDHLSPPSAILQIYRVRPGGARR